MFMRVSRNGAASVWPFGSHSSVGASPSMGLGTSTHNAPAAPQVWEIRWRFLDSDRMHKHCTKERRRLLQSHYGRMLGGFVLCLPLRSSAVTLTRLRLFLLCVKIKAHLMFLLNTGSKDASIKLLSQGF